MKTKPAALSFVALFLCAIATSHGANFPCEGLDSDLVVIARVAQEEARVELDDPEGVAGWLYYLDVLESMPGQARSKELVITENTTARVMLTVGRDYVIFAYLNPWGLFELSDTTYQANTELEEGGLGEMVVSCGDGETRGVEQPQLQIIDEPLASSFTTTGSVRAGMLQFEASLRQFHPVDY